MSRFVSKDDANDNLSENKNPPSQLTHQAAVLKRNIAKEGRTNQLTQEKPTPRPTVISDDGYDEIEEDEPHFYSGKVSNGKQKRIQDFQESNGPTFGMEELGYFSSGDEDS